MQIIKDYKSNKILRKKSLPVEHIDNQIKTIIKEMRQLMNLENGVGLAAPQVGLNQRFFVVELDNKYYVFINPQILQYSKELVDMEEGCLSIPDQAGVVARPAELVIEAYGTNEKKFKLKAKGVLARVIQHENDHLDGILFIDKAKSLRPKNSNNY
ncbi:MAG TPA: peptide deformylase [Candidatus Paceibacterota bacterium]|nr:peptide deformylase [Candidatus Paceibacterota bacterium]